MRVAPKVQKRATKIPPPLKLAEGSRADPEAEGRSTPNIEITAPTSDEGGSSSRTAVCKGGLKNGGHSAKGKGHGRSKSAPQQCWSSSQQPVDTSQMQPQPACQHSPSMKSNITIPKRRYSLWRKDSLIDMDTPEFTEVERRLRKSVPSSPQTVLALSGLFICGLMLVLSGTIVLFSQSHELFRLAGLTLLMFCVWFMVICSELVLI